MYVQGPVVIGQICVVACCGNKRKKYFTLQKVRTHRLLIDFDEVKVV